MVLILNKAAPNVSLEIVGKPVGHDSRAVSHIFNKLEFNESLSVTVAVPSPFPCSFVLVVCNVALQEDYILAQRSACDCFLNLFGDYHHHKGGRRKREC